MTGERSRSMFGIHARDLGFWVAVALIVANLVLLVACFSAWRAGVLPW